MLNSFTPWSRGLFGAHDRTYYIPFFISTLTLHWLSVAVTTLVVRRAGLTLTELGLKISIRQAFIIVGRLVAIGLAFVLFRQFVPYSMSRPTALVFFPIGFSENLFFIFASLNAGFCEELVYRGFAITTLQAHGLSTWQAVTLSLISFVFIHGLAGVYAFPIFFLAGLIYAGIYVKIKHLTTPMALHAFYDMTAILFP